MLPATHVAMAAPIVLGTHMSFAMGLAFLVGSVLPDKLDFFVSGGNFQTWSRIHRTWTHTWWIPTGILLVLFCIPSHSDMLDLSLLAGKGLFLGFLYHIVCDVLTPMGIPFLNPMGRKYSIGIIASRGFRALILSGLCWLLTAWLVYRHFLADGQYAGIASEYLDRLTEAFPQIKILWQKLIGLIT